MQKKLIMNFEKNILVTGGAGFIGSHVIRLLINKYPNYRIVNLDLLTYAGNLENLSDVDAAENYVFEKGDIVDTDAIMQGGESTKKVEKQAGFKKFSYKELPVNFEFPYTLDLRKK